MVMLAVRRSYLVALIVAAVAAVGYVVVPKVSSAVHAQDANDALVAANAAFGHLRMPRDFEALKSDPRDCPLSYPCYRVQRPTRSVAKQLPGILKSAGVRLVDPAGDSCLFSARHPELGSCSFGGVSHGYQVVAFVNWPPSCAPTPVRAKRRVQAVIRCAESASIVQLIPPYIPEDSEPWNGGSGWPLQ